MASDVERPVVAVGPDGWEEPLSRRAPSMPVLRLEGFDGPADLLLDLAERQRIDLGAISIRALAEQFADAVERLAGTVPLGRRADWLVLAARLVLLRARLLFPATPAEAARAERDAAAELRRLDGMAFIRAVADWLEDRPKLGVDVFARPAEPPEQAGGYVALMEACLAALRGRAGRRAEAVPVHRAAIPDLWRVPDATARIRAVLAERPEGGELPCFLPAIGAGEADGALKARATVASTFVAGLELAKGGSVDLGQTGAFAPIHLAALVKRIAPGK